MPKIVKYPRLKIVSRRNAAGKVTTHYYYDQRSQGGKYLHLGKDHADALRQWRELHLDAPKHAGTLQEAANRFSAERLPAYTNPKTRKDYANQLARITAVFGHMRFEDIQLPALKAYLDQRTGKYQANREMAVLSIVWSAARLWGITAQPWPAAGIKGWKNKERARKYRPKEDVFEAIYAQADATLRDAMDIASATGMRLTDARTVLLPGKRAAMAIEASKTGKAAQYDTQASKVLPPLIKRRRALFATHDYLLSTPDGRPVSERMITDRFAAARNAAAAQADQGKAPDLASRIRQMIARDCRKFAANQASSLAEAQALLQHDNERMTREHYRDQPAELKPVR